MTTKSTPTQKSRLETYLRGTGRTITKDEASKKFGIANLRARIFEMRQAGLKVTTKKVKGQRQLQYVIARRDNSGVTTKIFTSKR